MKILKLLESSANYKVEFMAHGGEFYSKYYSRELYNKNHDMFDRIKYMNPRELEKESVYYITDDDKVIAAANIQQSPSEPEVMWLKFVSVDNAYRQQGLATKLLNRIFEDFQNNGKILHLSSYTKMGEAYLKPLITRIRQDYPKLRLRQGDRIDGFI
jgi:predicted GNAT family acetyltransferase